MLLRSLPSQSSFRPTWSAVHAAGQLPARCRGTGAAGRLLLAHSKFSNRIAAANEARSFATESNPSTNHIENAAIGTEKGNGAFEGTTEHEGRTFDAVEVAEKNAGVRIWKHISFKENTLPGPKKLGGVVKGNTLRGRKKTGRFVMRSVWLRLEQSSQADTDAGGAEKSSGASEEIAEQGGQSSNASNTAETERDALMRKFSRTGLFSSPSLPRRGPRRGKNTTAARGKNAVPSKVFYGKVGMDTPKSSSVRSGSRKESARRKMDEPRVMDRLEKLVRMESLFRSDAAQAGGMRIGAITRDTIMDDDSWQRLKQEVGKIAQEKAEPLDGAQAKEHECHENQEMGDENSRKDEDATFNPGGKKKRKSKADPARVQSMETKISRNSKTIHSQAGTDRMFTMIPELSRSNDSRNSRLCSWTHLND
ncbi:uncharacterized protein LTHEOB_3975 [Lasiodiplodia theobromae]|uniref:uncharacterized protein n=1 Tax=Lasiodiplodia theobromae TaxID=45133 RepID=UPI0015C3661C|nr:uncharacterized protein LTHEOB_3975 [Lasiodiplodia theobromae]KAF4546667.1 hypothetical protein LTHEOB_3975 [Lasiodiplodia theobromae]